MFLFLLCGSIGAWATDYVFVYNGNYLSINNSTIANSTSFVPNTCIWTCTNNLDGTSRALSIKIGNNTRYLNSSTTNGASPTLSNTAQNVWRSDGTYLWYRSNNNYYLYYRNNKWMTSRNDKANKSSNDNDTYYQKYSDNTDYRATVYKVTTTSVGEVDNITEPTISFNSSGVNIGGNTITLQRNGDLSGSYTPAYTKYTFNGHDHCWYNDADHIDTPPASVTLSNPTYEWSITQGGSYATINKTSGVVTLTSMPTTNQTIRVQLKSTSGSITRTKTQDITFSGYKDSQSTLGTPTVSCTGLSTDAKYVKTTHTNVTGKYVPAYSTFTIGGVTYKYSGGTIYENSANLEQDWSSIDYTFRISSGSFQNNGSVLVTSTANKTTSVYWKANATATDGTTLSKESAAFNIKVVNVPSSGPTVSFSCAVASDGSGIQLTPAFNGGNTYTPEYGTVTAGDETFYVFDGICHVSTPEVVNLSSDVEYSWNVTNGSVNNNILTLANTKASPVEITLTATKGAYTGTSQKTSMTVTKTAASSPKPTFTVTGVASDNSGLQLEPSVSGKYVPEYYTIKNGSTNYYLTGSTYSTSTPSGIDLNDVSYGWTVTNGSVTNNVLTLSGTSNVSLTANKGDYYSATSDVKELTVTSVAEEVKPTSPDIIITPKTATMGYGTTQAFSIPASIETATTTIAPHKDVTDGSTHYYIYDSDGKYYTSKPEGEKEYTTVNFASATWTATEDGYVTITPDGRTATVKYNGKRTGDDNTRVTLKVDAVYGEEHKDASAIIALLYSNIDVTGITGTDMNMFIGEKEKAIFSFTPDNDNAGVVYKNFTFESKNEGVATIDKNGIITAVSPGTADILITYNPEGKPADRTRKTAAGDDEKTLTVTVGIKAPTVEINDDGTFTITDNNVTGSGATIKYTTDGSDPVTSTTAQPGTSGTATSGQTVKAVAIKGDGASKASTVASEFYAKSGVSGGKVVLNDYEDHTWTYYSGVDTSVDGGNYNTNYKGKLYSPNPRNVKITYKGNGGKVSIDESETEFVYYKTLEESSTTGEYQYQVISNPFSNRPTGKGFGGWQITKGADYIKGKAANATLALDEEIVFENLGNPGVNATAAEIEFTATWVNANITRRTDTGDYTYSVTGGNYETNILVIQRSQTGTITTSSPVTIMMVEPDGSADYRTNYTFSGNITPNNNGVTKIEFTKWNSTNTLNCNNHSVTVGRGMTTTSQCASYVTGVTGKTENRNLTKYDNSLNYHLKLESGTFTNVSFLAGNDETDGYVTCSGSANKVRGTLGNDYDRSKADNTKLIITNRTFMGYRPTFAADNKTVETFKCWVKSGNIGSTITVNNNYSGDAGGTFYVSLGGAQTNVGKRTLIVEGGILCGIAGGIDSNNNSTDETFFLRMSGGTVRGVVYGCGAFAATSGHRRFVFTGGQVNGWIAAGCNGTTTTSTGDDVGRLPSDTYVYFGGNASCGTASTTLYNTVEGGNLFGAGNGGTYNANRPNSGEVQNSNVVVADKSFIYRNAYGGGNQGHTANTANIYITGGHIQGSMFGGSNKNSGTDVNVYMNGGNLDKGLYGGSNSSGTISNNVTMQINGGQVGTTDASANIHGGGYGQPTRVTGNIDVTLGKTGSARDAEGVTVYGDVYGGSALGYVNGTSANASKHTNVTMNAGEVNGSIYGGGLGQGTTAANVYGAVQVTVNGGSVNTTSADGSGAVYGCNNVYGAPQSTVKVDIYGTNSAPSESTYALDAVYGGGNKAAYASGTPQVTVHNCDNSIGYVYGGGNAANITGTGHGTDVTIWGGNVIGNVFGGGNGTVTAANVAGGTKVTIHGGRILNVYGGSNSQGTIGGEISVTVAEQAEAGHDLCAIDIDNVFGGGNLAPSAAATMSIGCASHIGAVYGGANQANITSGDIDLTIAGGHIDNVFGGNNISGTISGTITVTVSEDQTLYPCGMLVGNVFGAGNLAAYSGSPTVNIFNGHLTGSVFGGGKGDASDESHAKGAVTGNPQVTIGDDSNSHTVIIDGNVFGGGDAANVIGKPKVLVQNCNTVIGTFSDDAGTIDGTVYGGGNAAHITGTGNGTNVTINGGSIYRVFGGGNGEVEPANVAGSAITTIHAGLIGQVFAGSNEQGSIGGSAVLTIDHETTACNEQIDEVYGGGNLAEGNAGTINIECGANIGDLYGGANQANVTSDITLNITGGTINRVFGGNNTSGNITGAITVNVNKSDNCDLDLNYVYGAGNQAAYTPDTPGAYPAVNILKGTVKQDVFGGGLGATAIVTSNPTVTVNGGTVSGNVFGGGSEANTVGTTSVTVQTGTVGTDVYGGGALADVEGSTTVAITGGTVTGNTYGGGLGRLAAEGVEAVAAAVTDNTTVTVSGGTTNNVFGCNNFNGGPEGTVNVTISGGTVTNDVYGGGNLAAATANPIVTINGGTMQDVYGGGLGESAVITGNTTININKTATTMSVANVFGGGSAANVAGNTAITMTEGTVGNIYGGGEAANVVVGADETGKTVVNMNGGTVSHSIYGGGLGNTTNVATSTTVTANGGTVTEDVYGGSGFGTVQATTVTINNGAKVTRDVFGGGFGQVAGEGKDAYEADVTGNASVTINKGAKISGNVYGGNNTNGSPKGTITVLVDGPADATEKTATPLNLKDVFGGGKNAATTSTGAPQVTIKGCKTVIARVFGGGDAASAPATDVTIWGGHITHAFGGGNGEVIAADVNGDVLLTVKGGVIENTYGGSNTRGNITGEVHVVVDKDPAACDMNITNLYGGGNQAAGKAGILEIKCTGDDPANKIENVYGGANAANVEGDVTLLISGGNIGNAFAGNNASGTINGAIKVVVDWSGSDCGVNNLDNVYGGGNLAPYTTPEDKTGPTVQLINATINNNVYGGGLGAPAKVTGNPIVTLEGATVTGNIFGGGDAAPVEGNPTVTATVGSAAKIFAGGKGATAVVTGNPTAVLNKTDEQTLTVTEIYGGGDAAEVTGNTTVTLTKGAVTNAFGGGNAAAINGNTTVSIASATASNVYGGGNLAGVTGTVTIGMAGGNVTTGLYGGCNSEGTVTGAVAVNVTGGTVGTDADHKANVHGGGYGSATQTAGDVAVAVNGAGVVVYGDVYGGSALGNVNDNTDDNTTVTITAGTVNGNVYGGGLGDTSNAALVNGNVAVNINGGTVTGNVFGCNNVKGTPKGSVAVTVAEDANANLAEVYGGGNMATYNPTTAQAPVVTINGCGNTIGYVYGGGNAADVPATNVTVWGGTIGNVFGGGHGNKDAVPATAANVEGDVTVNIKGGTITNVFAGSNSKGNISGTVALTIDKDGDCEMHITDVYGGGNQAAGNAGTVTIGCTGGEDEGIQNVYGGANAADIGSKESPSNIALMITGGNINNVFGGNNSSGTIYGTIDVTVDWNGTCTNNHINNVYGAGNEAAYTGNPTVKIFNGTVSQNVFGGGLGASAIVTGNPVVTIGDADNEAKVAKIGGDVYGGGDAAAVVGTTQVNVIAKENTTINNVYGGGNAANVNGTDVNIDGGHITGMVFGGGHGNASSSIAANVNGNVSVDVTGGTINKVFGGSNDMGDISGTVAVNINKGDESNEMHITEVYGGGNVAAGNAGTVTIGCTGGDTEGIGTVYGGANNANVGNDIVLSITGGSIDNVFGGNNNGGAVAGTITVNVNWTGSCGTNKLGNVYGAGNIASYTGNPTVNIINCTTTGSVFGGGKGKPAVVVGNPIVNIGSWTAGEVYIGGDVFGGGDLAAVEGNPTVTIRDCNTLIMGDLYGGGNAAPVYSTNTTMWGGTVKGNVFGGGNGADPTKNENGAQVGYDRNETKVAPTATITGNATLNVFGGTIGTWNGDECTSGGGIFGGSNTKGNIAGTVNLTLDARKCTESGATVCPLKIKEVYGSGNEAAYAGEGINFNLGCVSALSEIYGGAKNADMNGDIHLIISSGHFNRVFGGNNLGGRINGSIKVTIDETGCEPVIIDELYGCGNNAAYSVYGYNEDGTVKTSGENPYTSPEVEIISFTHIGKVFGGGYGAGAVVAGNPTVNINVIPGEHAEEDDGTYLDEHKLGSIGTVFGGGNAANVVGNTSVNIGTESTNAHIEKEGDSDIDTDPKPVGANITGNVYGGGNAADVTGKTNVVVGQPKTTPVTP